MSDQDQDIFDDNLVRLSSERERAIENLGRRAGNELRSPAPSTGLSAILKRSRHQRMLHYGVAAVVAVAVLMAGAAAVSLGGNSDRQPTDGPSVQDTVAAGSSRLEVVANRGFTYVLPPAWEKSGSFLTSASSRTGEQEGTTAMVFWAGADENTYVDPCLGLPPESGPYTIGTIAAAVAAMPGTELVSGPADVTVGALAAMHVRVKVREVIGCDAAFFYDWKKQTDAGTRVRTEVGDTIDVWIVDVDGVLLFITGEVHPDAHPSVELQIRQIVDSINYRQS